MPRFSENYSSSNLRELQSKANQFFERLFSGEQTNGEVSSEAFLMLRTDVLETGDGYRVRADLPGVDRKNLQIDVTEKRISIRGRCRGGTEGEGRAPSGAGAPKNRFCRSIALPKRIDPEKVEAVLQSGILIIDLPKEPTGS